jgi:argininosuccinate lyase
MLMPLPKLFLANVLTVTFRRIRRKFHQLKRMKKISSVSRSGRFANDINADVAQFTESISFDWRLWRHDILGSMAHAEMLHKIGVLKKNELHAIVRGLDAIGKEIRAGKFKWKPELEDVHMNIEAELAS